MQAILQSKHLRVLSVILLAQAVLFYTASHGDSRPLRQPLEQFPEKLPGWEGIVDGVVDQDTRNTLRADDVMSRFYVRSPLPEPSQMTPEVKVALINRSYEFFMEYFSTQQQGQSPHSPKNCLPGSGWQPTQAGEITIPIQGIAAPITINKYIVTKGEAESVVLYWYQSHGRVVASEFAAKYYLVADSIRYHRSDEAMIRVVVPVGRDGADSAVKNATDLVQAAFPAILNFLPR